MVSGVRRVRYCWAYRLDDLAAQIRAILEEHPAARLVALSHAVAPLEQQEHLDLSGYRGLFFQAPYKATLKGRSELTLLYTAVLVLEEPTATERYPRPPGS